MISRRVALGGYVVGSSLEFCEGLMVSRYRQILA
jgi:hypothetical protein